MVKSRGVPSAETLWLPPHYSQHIKRFQDEREILLRSLYSLEDVLKHVFSPVYQETYYRVALLFLRFLIERKGIVESDEISSFLKENAISKATFYNRVLPKLRRFGLIKVERKVAGLVATKKKRKMIISLSKTFGNYLMKIADSWLAIVDEVRSRE